MNSTKNFGLSQWEKSDRIQMEAFNADNLKTETALTEHAAALAGQAAMLSKCGNCKIEWKTYMGNGQCGEGNVNTVTFSAPPLMVFVGGYDARFLIMFYGHNTARNNDNYPVTITWNGSTVSWYSEQGAHYQCNMNRSTYYVAALIAVDA